MKRTFAFLSVLSLALVMTFTAVAQAPVQAKPERLTKKQLNALIATAKTAAEHERIARFYELSAQDYRAQAQEHEAMVAAYKVNPFLSTNKNKVGTIDHCQYFVTTFKDMAVKSEELAQLHEQMAKGIEEK